MRPNTLIKAVEKKFKSVNRGLIALCEFLDEFYTRPEDRPGMIAEDPGFLDDDIYDAWIGGVGEHLARRWGLRAQPGPKTRDASSTIPGSPTTRNCSSHT